MRRGLDAGEHELLAVGAHERFEAVALAQAVLVRVGAHDGAFEPVLRAAQLAIAQQHGDAARADRERRDELLHAAAVDASRPC